jgi:hypothetical protein
VGLTPLTLKTHQAALGGIFALLDDNESVIITQVEIVRLFNRPDQMHAAQSCIYGRSSSRSVKTRGSSVAWPKGLHGTYDRPSKKPPGRFYF